MWYLDESHDLAVAQIPRCGLTTIAEWLGYKTPLVANDDPRLLRMSRRVAFVRDPIDRLESAFSQFYWLTRTYHHPLRNIPNVDSWEIFIDQVLDESKEDDGHWRPQSIHCGGVQNIVHKLEDLSTKFEIYRPGILSHKHLTSRAPTIGDRYRVPELLEKYADDAALYRDAV